MSTRSCATPSSSMHHITFMTLTDVSRPNTFSMRRLPPRVGRACARPPYRATAPRAGDRAMLAAMRGDPRSCRALIAAALLVLAGCGFGLAGCAGGGAPPPPGPPPPPPAGDGQGRHRLAPAAALWPQL